MPHPLGIVIGNFVKVERGCKIYQHVTLGDRLGKKPGRPTLKAGSVVYAHGLVLGDVMLEPGEYIRAGEVRIG